MTITPNPTDVQRVAEDIARAQRTEKQIRAIVRDEQGRCGVTSIPNPGGVIESMHAIRAVYPGANVSVELRDKEGYAAVTVMGMPEDAFSEDRDTNEYPNCWWTRGGYLNVVRYRDGDIEAALVTALDIITTHAAVTR